MNTYEVKVTFKSAPNTDSYFKGLHDWFNDHFIDGDHEELVDVEITEKPKATYEHPYVDDPDYFYKQGD